VNEFKSRRKFLFETAGGLSGLGLAHLLDQDGLLAAQPNACSGAAMASPLSPRPPHFRRHAPRP